MECKKNDPEFTSGTGSPSKQVLAIGRLNPPITTPSFN